MTLISNLKIQEVMKVKMWQLLVTKLSMARVHLQWVLKRISRPHMNIITKNFVCKCKGNFLHAAISIAGVIIFSCLSWKNVCTSITSVCVIFLHRRHIQGSKKGHCSIEDAKATMDLVKLKLSKGVCVI